MPSAFLERDSPPGDGALAAALGKASPLWKELQAHLAAAHAPLSEKWSFSGKTQGWILKLSKKKQTVVYLVPCPGFFVASFALREEVCEAARRAKLPAAVLETIDRAPTYAEGRGVRLEVRARKELANVEKLAALKMST
ncbi:MAG: DUF3788 family protein [bacterium]